MSVWKETCGSISGLECSFTPACPYCKRGMEGYLLKMLNFGINDGTDSKNSYAIDVEVICPECGLWEPFGVAVSKGHWKNLEDTIVEVPIEKMVKD